MQCLYMFVVYLIFGQQRSNWLFGHCRTLASLLGKRNVLIVQIHSVVYLQIVSDTKHNVYCNACTFGE